MNSSKNVLVIGSGGREHAIIKKLRQSSQVGKIFCYPGNDGMLDDAETMTGSILDFEKVKSICNDNKINLVFIGPEEPLVHGLSDFLRSQNIPCVGPSRAAAQLEGSKIFAKEFMNRARVPTAKSYVVQSVSEALEKSVEFQPPYILKADGLAAGKGVYICKSVDELKQAAQELFEEFRFGDAGKKALLEQNLPGWELSFLVLTNGETFEVLPLAQDHKRLLDHNLGPNTGGMGTIAPLKIDPILYQRILDQIITPSIHNLKKENLLFRGILFVGLMVVEQQPYVLEYNTRFGDPETQVILPLIENDLFDVFENLANGHLTPLIQNQKTAVCIVNASEGYPDKPQYGAPLQFSEDIRKNLIFAGVKNVDNQLVTSGGRVLNVVAVETTKEEALKNAYQINSKVDFKNRQFRKDIGKYF